MRAAVVPAAAQYEVVTRTNIEYVEHDGTKLTGDLYLPKGVAKAPGHRRRARRRLAERQPGDLEVASGRISPGTASRCLRSATGSARPGIYPAEVYDVKSAIQFVRAKAADLGVDPDRIAPDGRVRPAGISLALVGLAHDQFTAEYRNDPHAATPANVKAVVAFYGIYDMVAQWQHDQIPAPARQHRGEIPRRVADRRTARSTSSPRR